MMQVPDWSFIVLPECVSTFNEARREGAWTVVRAVRQTGGRGRFNRTWFGEPGGMWATFNVPLEGEHPWGLLPLVAGVAIMRALRCHAIPGLRLRWPNDVLVGRAKLAGILVERPRAELASIGIGLNVNNDVLSLAGRVQDPPARLADLVPACPGVEEITARLAGCIASVFGEFVQGGLQVLAAELQRAWAEPRAVVAHTDHGCISGLFLGVQAEGSPILRVEGGGELVVPGREINRLEEVAPGAPPVC